MMRTLYILRHFKSRWDEEGVPDIDRRLSERGKAEAMALGKQLAQEVAPPDSVVASSARRARGTARRVARAWGYQGDIVVDGRLYGATLQSTLSLLQEIDDGAGSVMLVGHNPHVEELVWLLGHGAVEMRTGTLVRIDLALDHWADLNLPAEGTIVHVWPRARTRA